MGTSVSHVVPQLYSGVDGAEIKRSYDNPVEPATDLWRWSLVVNEGRQTWEYLTNDMLERGSEHNDPVASRYHVGLPITPEALAASPCPCNRCRTLKLSDGLKHKNDCITVEDNLRCGMRFFGVLQTQDGHWAGDYGGPMFLLPGLAIVSHITKHQLPASFQAEIVRYLRNMQNKDGGWGIHIESISTVFGTVLNYVAMRIFGLDYEDECAVLARQWIRKAGGCIGIPQWGKFWLAVLNVYHWDGVNSLFPEMTLLPRQFPLHPSQMWCYCRTVYCSMSWLYGMRFQCGMDALIEELRRDLFVPNAEGTMQTGPYHNVDWNTARNYVHPNDLYTPHTWLLDLSFSVFNFYEKYIPKIYVRQWALDYVYTVAVTKEDEFTNYIDIGPVNKVLNMLCVWVKEGSQSEAYRKHVERLPDYLWMGRDGMKMNGTNGSQLWDTSFLVQGMMENEKMRQEFSDIFDRSNNFLDVTQIRIDHPEHDKYWRDATKGGWPFSTRDMGWVVADCTGEGLKAALLCLANNLAENTLSMDRIHDSVDLLLRMQNPTGGYATCEKTRGSSYFEYFNASEVFGEIMIDYDYVECTSSSLQALALFAKLFPKYRSCDIQTALTKAVDFILSIQRPDGSWEGMWGICFTYGTWFAIDGLISANVEADRPEIRRACAFLLSKQMEDGGWGESFLSCVEQNYAHHPRSQVVNTAWAVLALLKTEDSRYKEAIDRGIKLLLERQLPDGDWPQESICGVFNKNCMISYSNFKNVFPLWALSRYTSQYPDTKLCA
mmetsp:Transcript_21636/g.60860  ORF Transcript_21636/g.60860 Transcript_21636/m.60860 type:complete len:774 (+) Transcript_21636:35-2356(+)|eukprot:CAMPEP_0119156248 /NCGR_PEP_ID=MMETSP1310-20130426/52158_1 /TAXON_ID=464262 /ORGANISM="Genus nov. species nov., Strain RCC2339" /LENGTH=773 /DNA_ID=CAMNT_0007148857 /DNA_START=58 /DNA_END=2379 /DNA_ORIENTATION=+